MARLRGLLGLLAFILVCLGFVFYAFLTNIEWLVTGTWVAAVGVTFIWIIFEYKKILAFLTRKSTRYGANLVLMVLLVLGILVVLNILGRDYHWRKDISMKGTNSLSEQSKKILRDLKQPVKAIYLAREDQREQGHQLLKRYAYESKNFSYELLNPNRYPSRVKALGLDKVENEILVLQLEGGRKTTVQGLTEEKLTNAMLKLLKTKNQTVSVVVGHGERVLEGADGSADSVAFLKKKLEQESYGVRPLNILGTGKIPEDTSVLAILGPKSIFFPKEIEILREWLDKGGRLLVALDLDAKAGGLSMGAKQIAAILHGYGMQVGSQLLVDPTSSSAGVEPQILMAYAASKDHLITKDFPSSTVGIVPNFLFPLTARLTNDEFSSVEGSVTVLAKTTPSAWAESDWASVRNGAVAFNQGKDYRGDMDLAYAFEKQGGPKIVVYGSSSLLVDPILGASSNKDLVMNSVSWLADNTELISLRPKDEAEADRLNLDTNLLGIIRLFVIFILPVSILATGIWVWHRRRGQ